MRAVAFLRGINVGGHRATKEALISPFVARGCTDTSTFLASGNVVTTLPDALAPDTAAAEQVLATALEDALGFPVPVFLRSGDDVRRLAQDVPFTDAELAAGGKPQVALLRHEPDDATRAAVLAHATDDDLLALRGRTLWWRPIAGISTAALDVAAVERLLGGWTMRTHNTIMRVVGKL